MTETNKEVTLEQVPCIHYPLCFQKNIAGVRTLINLGSEVNAITPAYAAKLSVKIRKTDIGAQKIDGSTLNIFEIVLASFQVEDQLERA